MARKPNLPRNDDTAPSGAAAEAAAAVWFARRDSGLTATEEVSFRRWLAADERNARAFSRLESAWLVFGKPQRSGAADQVLAELEQRGRRRRRRRAALTGLAVMVAIASGTAWQFSRRDEGIAAARNTAKVLAPDRCVLPDGSTVILKPGAHVVEAFGTAVRRVELTDGEAMFLVRKDPTRPFVVSAHGVDVRAVGTAFSVQLARERVEVVIAEGVVAVEPSNSPSSPPPPTVENTPLASAPMSPMLVKAGHRVVIESSERFATSRVVPVAAPELDERLAWRHPRVEFSGTPLGDAVALLNREMIGGSAAKLVADSELESLRISGIFRTDNIDAFVLLLEAGFGIKAERSTEMIRLRKAPAAVAP